MQADFYWGWHNKKEVPLPPVPQNVIPTRVPVYWSKGDLPHFIFKRTPKALKHSLHCNINLKQVHSAETALENQSTPLFDPGSCGSSVLNISTSCPTLNTALNVSKELKHKFSPFFSEQTLFLFALTLLLLLLMLFSSSYELLYPNLDSRSYKSHSGARWFSEESTVSCLFPAVFRYILKLIYVPFCLQWPVVKLCSDKRRNEPKEGAYI